MGQAIGVIAGAVGLLIGVFVLFEKITGVTGRWSERAIRNGTSEIESQLADLASYQKHHLGPNGDTPPLHTRITSLEKRLDESQQGEDKKRVFLEWLSGLETRQNFDRFEEWERDDS